MIHICIYTYTYICVYYISQSSIFWQYLYLSVSCFVRVASQSGGDPTEQPRRPQSLQRFKRTVPQRTSWVLVDLPHFAKRGRSVYCEQFAQQQQIIHSDTKMYVSCVYQVFQCIKLIWQFSKVLFLPGKHQNWELPAQAHFWFGLKNVPYICVSSIGCEKRHMLSVLITVSCRFRCEKKKSSKNLHSDRFWATCVCGRAWIILVELLGCPAGT